MLAVLIVIFLALLDVECTPVHDRVRFFELELDRLRRSHGHRITFAGVAVD